MTYQLLALKTESGFDLLAYTKGEFSKKEVRRLTKKFRNEAGELVVRAGLRQPESRFGLATFREKKK
jgi:hypothetical protein